MLSRPNTNPTDRELRVFAGLLLPLSAVAIAWLLWQKLDRLDIALLTIAVAGVGSVIGLIRPARFRAVYVSWMVVTFPIGWVISLVVIGMVFFLVVTPIGLAMRFLGRDPLNRRFEREVESYWQPCETPDDVTRYFQQF